MLGEVRGLDAVPQADRPAAGSRRPRIVSSSVVLPGAVWPDQGDVLAALERERDLMQQLLVAGAQVELLRLDDDAARRAGFRNSKPSVRRGPGPSSTCPALMRSICFSFDFACFAFVFLAPKRSTKRSSWAISSRVALGRPRGMVRARCLLAPPDMPLAGEEDGAPAVELEHGGRDGLQEPAVVRDEDDARVDRLEHPLEPLERLDVEVVRGLVEQQQVGLGRRARARARRASARRPRRSRAAGRGRRRRSRARARRRRPGRASRSRPRARAAPAPTRTGPSSSVVAAARHASLELAKLASTPTRSAVPASTYSRSGRSLAAGGRWSCSATRAPCSNASSPPWSDTSPVSARSSVVLPAPFGPASATRSPRSTLKATPSKSGCPRAPSGARMRSGLPP